VDHGEWEVTKDEAQPAAQQQEQLFDNIMSLAAIEALIVAILHQCQRGGCWSQDLEQPPSADPAGCDLPWDLPIDCMVAGMALADLEAQHRNIGAPGEVVAAVETDPEGDVVASADERCHVGS
jgi:hypothetical protein